MTVIVRMRLCSCIAIRDGGHVGSFEFERARQLVSVLFEICGEPLDAHCGMSVPMVSRVTLFTSLLIRSWMVLELESFFAFVPVSFMLER